MSAENPKQTRLDQSIDDLKEHVREMAQGYEQQIDDLNTELEQLKSRLKGYLTPDYGMLPVSPEVHEAVIQIARSRDLAPGVVMMAEPVTNHLLKLINREII